MRQRPDQIQRCFLRTHPRSLFEDPQLPIQSQVNHLVSPADPEQLRLPLVIPRHGLYYPPCARHPRGMRLWGKQVECTAGEDDEVVRQGVRDGLVVGEAAGVYLAVWLQPEDVRPKGRGHGVAHGAGGHGGEGLEDEGLHGGVEVQ